MYYEYSEGVNKIAGHRILAVDRGEREGFLKVAIEADRETVLNIIYNHTVIAGSPCTKTVIAAADDAFDRLIFPSVEREIRNILTDTAATAAIKVFGVNLKHLLMQPPIKGYTTLGYDPAFVPAVSLRWLTTRAECLIPA